MVIEVQLVNSEKTYLSKWVSLPCVPTILEHALDEIDAKTSQEYTILNIKCKIEGFCTCINESTSLGELNEAAFLLQYLPHYKHQEVMAFISDRAPNMTDLLLYLQSLHS